MLKYVLYVVTVCNIVHQLDTLNRRNSIYLQKGSQNDEQKFKDFVNVLDFQAVIL